MVSRSAVATDVPATAAKPRRARATRTARARSADNDQACALVRSAVVFAVHCHAGQRRSSDGAPFIEHPLEVAGLLRDAGCADVLVAAALLHHVVRTTEFAARDLTERFGLDVAELVSAVSDDASVYSYRRRKQVLREQVHRAAPNAALLFAADRISNLRQLPEQVVRDRARFDAAAPGSHARGHLAYFEQVRFDHYRQSLQMLHDTAPGHPLVKRLADELDHYAITRLRHARRD